MSADLSKYGTYIETSPVAMFKAPALGVGAPPARLPPNGMVRFGYKSPYRLYHQARGCGRAGWLGLSAAGCGFATCCAPGCA